jgi:hypothetical protein
VTGKGLLGPDYCHVTGGQNVSTDAALYRFTRPVQLIWTVVISKSEMQLSNIYVNIYAYEKYLST